MLDFTYFYQFEVLKWKVVLDSASQVVVLRAVLSTDAELARNPHSLVWRQISWTRNSESGTQNCLLGMWLWSWHFLTFEEYLSISYVLSFLQSKRPDFILYKMFSLKNLVNELSWLHSWKNFCTEFSGEPQLEQVVKLCGPLLPGSKVKDLI